MGLYLLDYGAGNVRSLANTLKKLNYDFEWIRSPDDFAKASVSATAPLRCSPFLFVFPFSPV